MPHNHFFKWLQYPKNKITPIIKVRGKLQKEEYVIKKHPNCAVKIIVIKNRTGRIVGIKLKVDENEKISYKQLKMDDEVQDGEETIDGEESNQEHWSPAWAWCSIL